MMHICQINMLYSSHLPCAICQLSCNTTERKKRQLSLQENLGSHSACPGKGTGLKKTKETLSLYLSLILDKKMAYNNQEHTRIHTHTQIENRREFDLSSLGIGDNPISIVTTLYDLNFQFSRTTKPQGIKNKV